MTVVETLDKYCPKKMDSVKAVLKSLKIICKHGMSLHFFNRSNLHVSMEGSSDEQDFAEDFGASPWDFLDDLKDQGHISSF